MASGLPASKPTEAVTHNDQGGGEPLTSLESPWAEVMAALFAELSPFQYKLGPLLLLISTCLPPTSP